MTLLPPPDPAARVHDRFSAALTLGAVSVGGSPSLEETAAIMAAVEHLWPRPLLLVADDARQTPSWRFSGRWWSRPTVSRRDRPWVR